MKSEDGSIFSRVSSWLRAPSKQASNVSQERERLRLEQLRLSAELESALSSYDARTRDLALRIVSPESEMSDEHFQKMYEEQLHLWKVIRRLQAADRTIPQLEQEYMEWKGRKEEGLLRSHPDHPESRMEFIASELRARGRSIPVRSDSSCFEGSAKDADPFEDLNLEDVSVDNEVVDDSQNDALQSIGIIPISAEIQQSVLDQIRECGRQIQKQTSSRDLAESYKELRMHHASLREIDRRTGVRRYRVVLHR